MKRNTLYSVKHTRNIVGGADCNFVNLDIEELMKYTKKSLLSGFPVWFAADVSQDFNFYHSTLDDNLVDEESIFGSNHSFNKGDKITFRNLAANHAMSLVGINLDHKQKPEAWQVENSWGYWDNETPGEDGFLYMSNSWFEKNVMQVVVHKNYLTRSVRKLLNKEPEQLDPWDIDIVKLTSKYFEKIEEMEESDFYISSKVLLAAALLLRIKSEFLLNKHLKDIDEILFGKKEESKISKEIM